MIVIPAHCRRRDVHPLGYLADGQPVDAPACRLDLRPDPACALDFNSTLYGSADGSLEDSGEDKAARLRVGIIAGSTCPGRQSRTCSVGTGADPIPSLDLRLIDLADSGLPLLSEPAPAAFANSTPAACHAYRGRS